jgi:hypothetical protein
VFDLALVLTLVLVFGFGAGFFFLRVVPDVGFFLMDFTRFLEVFFLAGDFFLATPKPLFLGFGC